MAVLSPVFVRFFFPLDDPFFFALVTLIGGGVAAPGMSSSTSYRGNDGGGTAGDALRRNELASSLLFCRDIGRDTGRDPLPWGSSPVLSITNVCGAGLGFRRLGSRATAFSAVLPHCQ